MKNRFTLISVITGGLAVLFLIIGLAGCMKERQAGSEYETLLGTAENSVSTSESADISANAEDESISISESNEETQESVETATEDASLEAELPVREDIDFTKLQERNPDIYAWIEVPGTNVDYPIVQHATDNSYYLTHTIDHEKTVAASIYTENYNSTDFTDHHTVIYGHNMKNGTMFRTLHNFEDAAFFEENRDIYIYVPEETRQYKIFAAYTYDNRHLLNNYYCEEAESFQAYLDEVFAIRDFTAYIDRDMKVTGEDYVITLSTCVNSGDTTQRYLVQAVLVSIN